MREGELIRKFPLVGFDRALSDEENRALAAEQLLQEMADPELRVRAMGWVIGYKAGIRKAQKLVNYTLQGHEGKRGTDNQKV